MDEPEAKKDVVGFVVAALEEARRKGPRAMRALSEAVSEQVLLLPTPVERGVFAFGAAVLLAWAKVIEEEDGKEEDPCAGEACRDAGCPIGSDGV